MCRLNERARWKGEHAVARVRAKRGNELEIERLRVCAAFKNQALTAIAAGRRKTSIAFPERKPACSECGFHGLDVLAQAHHRKIWCRDLRANAIGENADMHGRHS